MFEPLADIKELQYRVAVHRDIQAYKQLYTHIYGPLMQFAASLVESKEVAEELFSDLMLKIWNMEDRLSTVENLKMYLLRSIKNASLNYLEQHNRRRVVALKPDRAGAGASSFFGDELLKKEFHQRLQAAIASLPPKCRMVYLLIKDEGMSYKQVAEVLSISANTVEGHMTTALKRITAQMRAYLNTDGFRSKEL